MFNWFVYKKPKVKKTEGLLELSEDNELTPSAPPVLDSGELVTMVNPNKPELGPMVFQKTNHGKLDEIEQLRLENEVLKTQLEQYRQSRETKIRSGKLSSSADQQQQGQEEAEGSPLKKEHYIYTSPKDPDTTSTTAEKAAQEEEGDFLEAMHSQAAAVQSSSQSTSTSESLTDSPVMVHATELDENKSQQVASLAGLDAGTEEVCVLDMKTMEWWTMKPHQQDELKGRTKEVYVPVEDKDLGDSYVLVQDGDLQDAISEFITQTLSRYPAYKSLDAEQLKGMMNETFSQLQEPSLFQKSWGWGQFLYSTYGWTTCCYGVYMDPAMAKFVFSTACSAVSWSMVLLL